MKTVYINGKFSAQRSTGVQRLALGLIQAIDEELSATDNKDRWILVCPPDANPPLLNRIEVVFSGPRFMGLHFWEQFFLPIYTAGQTLLNLAGPAPLMKHRQACMLPDAAVFDYPEAYTKPFGAWYRFSFTVMSRSARLLLTISEFSKCQLILALGNVAERVKVVYCAAGHIDKVTPDTTIIDSLGLAHSSYLLAVGSINPTKNLSALIAAFGMIEDPNVKLVIVGADNTAVFARQSLFKGGDSRIISTGAIDDPQLSALYRNALAVVFPSLYEGFGLPPLEAMLLGCPVVAARAASIPEVCNDAAIYFDPNSLSDMKKTLEYILMDAELRELLRQRGLLRAHYFTWQCSAKLLLRYIADAGLSSKDSLTSAFSD
jgi:glycosyltransferase involved in cell wall biosynthesis